MEVIQSIPKAVLNAVSIKYLVEDYQNKQCTVFSFALDSIHTTLSSKGLNLGREDLFVFLKTIIVFVIPFGHGNAAEMTHFSFSSELL